MNNKDLNSFNYEVATKASDLHYNFYKNITDKLDRNESKLNTFISEIIKTYLYDVNIRIMNNFDDDINTYFNDDSIEFVLYLRGEINKTQNIISNIYILYLKEQKVLNSIDINDIRDQGADYYYQFLGFDISHTPNVSELTEIQKNQINKLVKYCINTNN